MAELKRNFSGGKMNKDMDERVLPAGQYRDANNIQISTSDGSDVGSLQTLLGNTNVTEDTVYTFIDPTISKVVGVKALPEKDKVYFMVYSGSDVAAVPVGTPQKDYIVEYNTKKKTTDFVFVDIHTAKHSVTTACADGTKVFKIKGGDQSWAHGIRVGMNLSGSFTDSGNTIGISSTWDVKVTKIRYYASVWWIHHDNANAIPSSVGDILTVSAPRVLKFNPHNIIHSIDILNDMMFWTDNQNEPKKIHLERSKRGTGGVGGPLIGRNKLFYHNTMPAGVMTNATFSDALNTGLFHTRLVKRAESTSTQLVVALNRVKDQPVYVKEDHITVIKKSPTNALSLKMFSTKSDRVNDAGEENAVFGVTTAMNFYDSQSTPEVLVVGDAITVDFVTDIDLRVGDVLMLTNDQTVSAQSFPSDEALVRATVASPLPLQVGASGPPNTITTGTFNLIINSIDGSIAREDVAWSGRVELQKPMFEFKFPRFSYRWRYQDGEYSTFAPWSEIAFLPGDFDYLPKKGFNLAMSNRLRYLKLENYFPEWGALPEDVIEVDLLYKETNKSTVYTVKTLKPLDGHPIWPDGSLDAYARGGFEIKSELIHAVVPSNQLLRPWDNVPRLAKTQVMTANRLVFGNYVQNYNIDASLIMNCKHNSYPIPDSQIEDEEMPNRSVKSLRTYQIGVVWSDKYGRETPVMVPREGGSVTIDKKDCVNQNYLNAKIIESVLRPPWAEFVSYYVKETSNEYYNLAMDRFYDAEDGNVWLSFPSAERNKVQADTYLYLKKAHDTNLPVVEKARYRVVAIENDAPLFIKKLRKSFGFETVEFATSGLPEPGRKYVRVRKTHFDNAFLQTRSPQVLDNLQIRIGGVSGSETYLSEMYDVAGIASQGTFLKLTLSKPLGEELGAISILSPTLAMKLEVVQNKFEDKPEFDGRFFVKILKDLTLQNELMDLAVSKVSYSVKDTMQMGYLGGNEGLQEGAWTEWREYHNGGDQYSTKNRWFIDNVDTRSTTGPANFATDGINSGGMYNWNGNNAITGLESIGCKGLMDISYSNWSAEDGISSQGSRFTTPWTYLKNVGTLFRFKQDPAQIVYRIEGVHGRLGSRMRYGSAPLNIGNLVYYNGNSVNESSSAPLIGGSGDYKWNHRGSGADSGDDDNQRYSFRIEVDKMFGSSSSHIFDDTQHVAMNRVHPLTLEEVPILNGERYDGGIVGGTVTSGSYNIGDPHNWWPMTSNSGAILNTANQLVDGTVYGEPNHWNSSTYGWRPPRHYTTYPNPNGVNDGKFVHQRGVNQYNNHDITIEFLEPMISVEDGGGETFSSTNPAIWETEPKEDVGLDIYYEASAKIPLNPDHTQNELLIPIGSKYVRGGVTYTVKFVNSVTSKPYLTTITLDINLAIALAHDAWIYVERPDKTKLILFVNKVGGAASGQKNIQLTTGENAIDQTTGAIFSSERAPWHNPMLLAWSNCWAFGNGVESDRVRDDYNAPQLDNGVKASTTLATPYEEERRSSGMIFSGIFNSTSGVNNLNQFIQAEPITKDINPSYGTIQRMHARNTNTLVFCEDKVLNILTNKDALYNADGNSNVTSSNNVLGAPTPIPGDYGISTSPESLAVAPGAMYWCDPMRGKVLKLEGNSTIKVLSDVGMKDYFNDTLVDVADVIGTYDEKKADYNISIGKKVTSSQVFSTKTTITYSEVVKGWVAFKSFEPEMGVSLNNEYYTFKNGQMWQHHVSESIAYSPAAVAPNNFYGVQYYPDVTLIFNEQHSSVKSFNLINYEGTQSRITAHLTDPDYYNLTAKTGWYVDNMFTDLQEIGQLEFKSKEGKWFSTVKGIATDLANLDEREFSVQGLGVASSNTTGTPVTQSKLTVSPGTQSNSGTNWDTSADSVDWNFTGTLTQVISSGTAYPAGYKDAILHNITFNQSGALVYSGLDLDAATFTVPGGTASTTGTGNATVYVHTAAGGWNADSGITKVEFTNVGIAGDPGNTVRARIYYSAFTAPSTAVNLFVDIDHGGSTSSGGNIYRNACVKVHYNQTANANGRTVTVAQTDIAGITETNIDQFDPNGHAQKSNEHEATNGVLQGQTTKMAEYTITAGNAEYLIPQTAGKGVKTQYHTHSSASPWQSYFSYVITNTNHTSTNNTNKIKKTVVEVFYTPPVGVLGLDPDPVSGEGDWCTFMHCVELTWLARPITTSTNNTSTLNSMGFTSLNVSGNQNILNMSSTSAGNVGLVLRSGSSYYTLPSAGVRGYAGAGSWSEGGSAVVNVVALPVSLSQSIDITLPNATTANTAFSMYAQATTGAGTNLALGANAPTSESPVTFNQQAFTNSTITNTALANTTRIPTATTGFSTTLGSSGINLIKNISVIYTAGEGKTIAINRQPNDSDFTGGNKNVVSIIATASGANVVRVSKADRVGLTTGMTIESDNTNVTIQNTIPLAANNDSLVFSASDYALVGIGTSVSGGTVQASTLVSAKRVVNGAYLVDLSKTMASPPAAGTTFTFSGVMVSGSTITGISDSSTYSNLTISNNVIAIIPTGSTFEITNGWGITSNLNVVMLETVSASSSAEVTTVDNKKAHLTGTVSLFSSGTAAANFVITPNFLTVS